MKIQILTQEPKPLSKAPQLQYQQTSKDTRR